MQVPEVRYWSIETRTRKFSPEKPAYVMFPVRESERFGFSPSYCSGVFPSPSVSVPEEPESSSVFFDEEDEEEASDFDEAEEDLSFPGAFEEEVGRKNLKKQKTPIAKRITIVIIQNQGVL